MALLEINDLHTFFKTKRGTVKAVNGLPWFHRVGNTVHRLYRTSFGLEKGMQVIKF